MSNTKPSDIHVEIPSELSAAASGPEIRLLIQRLSSSEVTQREQARVDLVSFGSTAVPAMLEAFPSVDDQGRLEIGKAFTEIADPAAVPALIQGLEDDQQELRWVSAEGLLNIGSPAVEPLLLALIDRAWAFVILDGAVHVLRGLSHRWREPIFAELIAAASRSPEPGVTVPPAAQSALTLWRELCRQSAIARELPASPILEPRGDKPWYDRRR